MDIGNILTAVLRASPKAGNHQRYHREFSCTASSQCAGHLGLNYMAFRVHFYHLVRNVSL